MSLARACVAAALSALAACSASDAEAPIAEQWRALSIHAEPIELGAERIGKLAFRGGLVLTSDDAEFGGLSGMEVLDGGRVLIVNDDAEWFEARLVLDERGWLAGFTDLRYAYVLDEAGEPLWPGRRSDSEGLTQLPDGRFAVSFEFTQSIRIYDLNRDGPFGAARAGPPLAGTAHLPSNAGIEALAAAANGDLIAGAEGGVGSPTVSLWRLPLDGAEPLEPIAQYRPEPSFSLTGLDRLPDEDFVAVERFYAPVIGGRTRITRFSENALGSGEVAPEELARIAPPLVLDNFETIAATRLPDGTTRLYVLSDDNYNRRQRTLLFAFDIVDEPQSAAAP